MLESRAGLIGERFQLLLAGRAVFIKAAAKFLLSIAGRRLLAFPFLCSLFLFQCPLDLRRLDLGLAYDLLHDPFVYHLAQGEIGQDLALHVFSQIGKASKRLLGSVECFAGASLLSFDPGSTVARSALNCASSARAFFSQLFSLLSMD